MKDQSDIRKLFCRRPTKGRVIKSPSNKKYLVLAEAAKQEIRARRRWTPEQIERLLTPIGHGAQRVIS